MDEGLENVSQLRLWSTAEQRSAYTRTEFSNRRFITGETKRKTLENLLNEREGNRRLTYIIPRTA